MNHFALLDFLDYNFFKLFNFTTIASWISSCITSSSIL
jgi:hypothetical protein